jgi:hypothetical protein
MAVALLSPEGRIGAALREIECPGRNFVHIAKARGVKISEGNFFECMNGKPGRRFDQGTGERLIELLAEMRVLHNEVQPLAIDWGRVDRVAHALLIKRIQGIDAEMGGHSLDRASEAAKLSLL